MAEYFELEAEPVMGWSLLPRPSDRRSGRLYRSCIAELVGSFSYVFWGCLVKDSLISPSSVNKMTDPDGVTYYTINLENTLSAALGFGLALAATIHVFSDISGSHFNPAISLAMFVVQRISLIRMLIYWIMQILGTVLAVAILDACDHTQGSVVLKDDLNEGLGFLYEMFGTLLWIYVALAATNDLRGTVRSNIEYPLYVGLAFTAMHLALSPLTGCGLNPARSLLANAFFSSVPSNNWVYAVGPLVASIVGGFTYELIFSNFYTDLKNYKPKTSMPKN